DLHVWAMGTSETALTAHLVLADPATDADALMHEAEQALHEHFEIRHVTLQLESPAYAQLCGLRAGAGCS
ncbi:MAG: cation transporter, partial [Lacisediminimonas sp.]|nr:cation transporter [Lacisediminimonas sp.]